jgi:hypothetical protein
MRRQVWDDKEEPHMNDKVLERNGRPQIMITNFCDMAYSFVLHNVELMYLWHK